MNPPTTHPTVSAASSRDNATHAGRGNGLGRILAAMLLLQGLTLLAVVGQSPALPEASAGAAWQSRHHEPVVPNAAEQRRQQLKLLDVIADQQADTNRRLESIQRALRDGEIRVRIVED